MNPAPSVVRAISVARNWSTIVIAAARVLLLSRSAFRDEPRGSVDIDPVPTSCPRPGAFIDDRRASVDMNPRQDRRFAVVVVYPASQFRFVACEGHDLVNLIELDYL
jgi:hypothetical protein